VFSQIGPLEIVLVLVIALVLLGPKRLPEAGRSLGRGMREFKDSLKATKFEDEPALEGRREREG
jgi:sec-independent protein translocase protein TatA